ncbi:hypothetical protein AGOR_G00079840, partial [Albula goreensis]
MGEISEESLLDYMFKEGGKVKNADLLKTYKQFISHSDQQLRAKYREEFKLIIDRIAVVKSENGEKYLVLKKKYRQQVQERESERASDSDRPRETSDSPPTPVAMVQWEGGEVSSQSRVRADPRGSSPKKGLCPLPVALGRRRGGQRKGRWSPGAEGLPSPSRRPPKTTHLRRGSRAPRRSSSRSLFLRAWSPASPPHPRPRTPPPAPTAKTSQTETRVQSQSWRRSLSRKRRGQAASDPTQWLWILWRRSGCTLQPAADCLTCQSCSNRSRHSPARRISP